MPETIFDLIWNSDFYKLWYYWILLVLLNLYCFCTLIGTQIYAISGLDRSKVNIVYARNFRVLAALLLMITFTSSLVAVLVSIASVVVMIGFAHGVARYFAYWATLHYLKFDEEKMQDYIKSHTYPLA